jgi:putative glutamine amidotransferase
MKRKPLIVASCRVVAGVIQSQGVQVTYLNALRDVGADLVLIPIGSSFDLVQRLMNEADGLLLTGGEDISPEKGGSFYGGINAQSNHVERDELELQLVQAALTAKKPILGICRGLQLLNVAFGGKLIADIEDNDQGALKHMGARPSSSDPQEVRSCMGAVHHAVSVKSDSWLAGVFGKTELMVNTFHHQAVDPEFLGKGLRVCAQAHDGTIEAIEAADMSHFIAAVQWHPEMLVHFGVPIWKTFFQGFVDVCRQPV